MNTEDFRRIALGQPEAEENSHFGKPYFRVRNRIFASLPAPQCGVLKLTPPEQAVVCESEPGLFRPVKGGWGRQGWTEVDLDAADEQTLLSACRMAWRNAAPPALLRRYELGVSSR
jgi:hypothetical protein